MKKKKIRLKYKKERVLLSDQGRRMKFNFRS